MSPPWWKRRHDRPFAAKHFLGMLLLVFGVMTLFGGPSIPVRAAGGGALVGGLFLYGDGLWWRTVRREK